MDVTEAAAVVTAALACVWDVSERRVPNVISLGSAMLAIAVHAWTGATDGAARALGGWFAGVVLFLPLVLLRGMGAGDLKLLAAVGAWLGPAGALWTGLLGSIAGAFWALALAAVHGLLPRVSANVRAMLRLWLGEGLKPVPGLTLADAPGPRLPFALPLTIGLLVTLWLRP